MEVQKTFARNGATLEHGVFRVVETVYVCGAGRRETDGGHAIQRAASLAIRIPPRCGTGYDVMVFIGLKRYVDHRQRDEIRLALEAEHGIRLSTGEISNLGRRSLTYIDRVHWARADRLRSALEADGGWPLHVDATGEQGRGTLLVAYTSWRRWVLGAWKIPTERGDAIVPRLLALVGIFGPPCAAVRDLGKAVTEALNTLVRRLELKIPILAGHQHFLADIGEDLLEESHDQLRLLVRRHKIRTGLAALARDLGRALGAELPEAREGLRQWQMQVEQGHALPHGPAGVACVRAMAPWVLDLASNGTEEGFPFDRPYLDLFERGWRVRRAIDAFLRRPSIDRHVAKALGRLARALAPLAKEEDFTGAARTPKTRVGLFEKLRAALRLTPKPTGRNCTQDEAVPVQTAASELQDIRAIKHAERRRCGRKTLAQDLAHMPASSALARNLRDADYVGLICGNLENLPAAFAELDREQASRKRREAEGLQCSSFDTRPHS